MSEGKNVFIVGPGFIGWNVLDLLVAEGYKVTGFVRRKEHGEQIQKSGAAVVYGDLNDKEAIAEQTVKHDIVMHTGTSTPSTLSTTIADSNRSNCGPSSFRARHS